jgi:hypothetical protein
VRVELLDQLLHFLAILGTVPEEDLAITAQAAIGRLHRAAEAAANIGKGFGASGASVEQKRAFSTTTKRATLAGWVLEMFFSPRGGLGLVVA